MIEELVMSIDDFIILMVERYKSYKKTPGMPGLIKEMLSGMESKQLFKLAVIIGKSFDPKYGPPNNIEIRKMATDAGMYIGESRRLKITNWRCGQCWEIYDYELRNCPNPDCRKPTGALPVRCVCGKFFPDDFVCCTKTENGLTMQVRIDGVRNDKREQNVRCNECGKSWNYFDITRDPYIYSGGCKGPGCGKPREAGRVIRRG